jgi:hypothetical protein
MPRLVTDHRGHETHQTRSAAPHDDVRHDEPPPEPESIRFDPPPPPSGAVRAALMFRTVLGAIVLTAGGAAFIGVGVAAALLAIMLTLAAPGMLAAWAAGGSPMLGGAVSIAVVIPLAILVLAVGRGHTACRDLLAGARCGACAYDLTASPVEPDGCVICPECGAAWRWAKEP